MDREKDITKTIESLSPNERKILPYIDSGDVNEICIKSSLDKTSVLRALNYLRDKKIAVLTETQKRVVDVGVNGALYRKRGLPERRLLKTLEEKKIIRIEEAERVAALSSDEFKAALGALKKKAFIELKNGKIILSASKTEIAKKSLEEKFLEALPLPLASLTPEQQHAMKSLEGRKNIVMIMEEKEIKVSLTDFGQKIISLAEKGKDLIEQITPDMLREESWRGKKFRRYNVSLPAPTIYGGKRHFVNQAIDYGRNIWTSLGFLEMDGAMVAPSFWNFDALFTAQDHSVREMQDTFFLDGKFELKEGDLPKKTLKAVKESHEQGISGSTGWKYKWDEEEAKRFVLRTHTTILSAQTLSSLNVKNLPVKFFAIGKCFRNETVDWSHGFEFNQTEGIVVDRNANFRHLLGYLKTFFSKMGFEKIRFRPGYFPYTEPSVEIDIFHSEKKVWLELGGAGIFRPEVTVPLLGESVPVLAWGPGFDRILMDYYKVKDLRELYSNDITQLRKMKFWMKT